MGPVISRTADVPALESAARGAAVGGAGPGATRRAGPRCAAAGGAPAATACAARSASVANSTSAARQECAVLPTRVFTTLTLLLRRPHPQSRTCAALPCRSLSLTPGPSGGLRAPPAAPPAQRRQSGVLRAERSDRRVAPGCQGLSGARRLV